MRPMHYLMGLSVALALLGGAPAWAASSCDRACLEDVLDKYLTALAARAPKKAPVAGDVVFIENNETLKLGDGTWATIDGLGGYRHVFADPQTGRVAAITTVKENGVPAIFDVALTVHDRKVVRAEHQVVRDARAAVKYEAMAKPADEWMQTIPEADRLPRDQLVATANKYFSGMQRNDPNGDYSFFDKDCNRLEHAEQTTNLKTPQAYGHSNDTAFSSLGCEAQFQTGFLGFVTEIRDRRWMAVDEERQAVFAFADFDHNGTVRSLPSVNGKSSPIPAYFDVARTLRVGEAFRMRKDKIYRIEMTLTELPYGMHPGGAAVVKTPGRVDKSCDRNCLSDKMAALLQAISDHDASEAPLAADVRFTENGQQLKLDDGLWNNVMGIAIPDDGLLKIGPTIAAYKLFLADPSTGQAAYVGATNERGTPGVLTLRIKVVAGKITEIEAFAVREEGVGPRGGTMTLFRPLLLTEFNAATFGDPDPAFLAAAPTTKSTLTNAAAGYFKALQRGQSAAAPLAADCAARINGDRTTGDADAKPFDPAVPAFKPFALGCAAQIDSGFFHYLSNVRGERVLLADADQGLVLTTAMLDHNGTALTMNTSDGPVTTPQLLRTPSTDFTVSLFKLDGGRISRIESLQRPAPYGMSSGWTN